MTEEMLILLIDGAVLCCQTLAGGFIIGQFLRALFSSSS